MGIKRFLTSPLIYSFTVLISSIAFSLFIVYLDAVGIQFVDKLLIIFVLPVIYSAYQFSTRIYVIHCCFLVVLSFWVLSWVESNYYPSMRTASLFFIVISVCGEFIFNLSRTIRSYVNEAGSKNALFHSMMEYSLQGITIFQNNRMVYANKTFASMVGSTVDEILLLPWEKVQELVHPDDRDMVWKKTHERLNKLRGPEQYEYRMQNKLGEPVWVIIFATPIDYNGEHAVQAVYIDISEQKKVELALRESEERFRLVEDAAQVGSWDWNIDEQFAFHSDQMRNILGIKSESNKITETEFLSLVHPDDLERVQSVMKSVREGIDHFSSEHRTLNPILGVRWLFIKGRSVATVKGHNNRYVGICMDITDRKTIEEEKEQLIEKLRKAVLNIRRLSGLLPICSSCKKIRDDEGYWSEVEVYIHDHSDADFTHSLCPDCLQKYKDELNYD